jgi:hypothetical protein
VRGLLLAGAALSAVAAAVVSLRDAGSPAAPTRGEEAGDPVRETAVAAPPRPIALPGLGGRTPAALAADAVPRHLVPTERAVAWLLSCRGPEGFFHEDRGVLEGDPPPPAGRAVATTALVCLVLVDAVSPTEDTPASRAARVALDRLATLQRSDGGLGDDLESHALAAWALAAAYSRTGRVEWGRTVAPALGRTLAAADPAGGWRSGRSLSDDLVLTAWAVASLYEAISLPVTVPEPGPASAAIASAAEWAASVEGERASLPGGARAALALLLRLAGDPAAPLEPEAALARGRPDHVACCLGTVFSFHDPARWTSWRDEVFLPALALQRREGEGAGSWDPAHGRGRVEATALETLAFLAVAVPFREPRGR